METYDAVKTELARRLDPICESYKNNYSHVKGLDRLSLWIEHLENNTKEFSSIMTDTLNQIIHDQKITFKDESEKHYFLEQIRPTNISILKKFAEF